MSFDAGSIVGKLMLDTTGFSSGILEAEATSELLGNNLTTLLSANPLILGLGAIREGASFVIETLGEVANEAANVSIEAAKVGVSVEFMSQMGAVAKTVKVDMEQLGMGIKFIQMHAEQALEGDKGAIAHFKKLGISVSELKNLKDDPEALYASVERGLDGLENSQQRILVTKELLGRAGGALIPLFAEGTEAIDKMRETAVRFHATETEESAKTGRDYKNMMVEIGLAWEGAKKNMAEPLLDELMKHAPEFEKELGKLSAEIGADLPGAMHTAIGVGGAFAEMMKTAAEWTKTAGDAVKDSWLGDWLNNNAAGQASLDTGFSASNQFRGADAQSVINHFHIHSGDHKNVDDLVVVIKKEMDRQDGHWKDQVKADVQLLGVQRSVAGK